MEDNNHETSTQKSAPVSADKLWKLQGTFPVLIDFLAFFGIFLLATVIAVVVAQLFGLQPFNPNLLQGGDAASIAEAQLNAGYFTAVVFMLTMSLTIAGFLFYRRQRHATGILARFSIRGFNTPLLLWGILFVFATSIVIEPLLAMLPDIPDVMGRGVWVFLTIVIAAPLFEEFLFRGVLLEAVRAKYGVMAAWLIPAICFGIVHQHPTLIVNAFIMGLILGFIYIKTGSLWSTIIIHAVNNAIAYLLLVRGLGGSMFIDVVGKAWLYTIIYIVALAVFAVSGYKMYRSLQSIKKEAQA